MSAEVVSLDHGRWEEEEEETEEGGVDYLAYVDLMVFVENYLRLAMIIEADCSSSAVHPWVKCYLRN